MTFRARLQVAFALLAVVAVGGLALAVRTQMTSRLTADYQQRVTALVDAIHDDLSQERLTIGTRLRALARAMTDDNALRAGLARGDRAHLLDYAGAAMRLAGLSMLQIEDSADRIVSSGHFRNEFDRQDHLPRFVAVAGGGVALTTARRAEGPFLALVRVDSVRLGGALLYLVGGIEIDRAYVARLARGPDVSVTLAYPGDSVASASGGPGSTIAAELTVPFAADSLGEARIVVRESTAPLEALRASVDRWALLAGLTAAIAALVAAWWISSSLSRPVAALADQAAALQLDKLDASFDAAGRSDEIGTLARSLADLVDRLRRGAVQLRDAERRATTGDLARQVNHDVKNGLVPIRNVLKHLAEVARDHPGDLPRVFSERKNTLDEGVAYLENLAANYARLTPRLDGGSADPAGLITELARALPEGVECRLAVSPSLPAVRGDAVVVRRILENVLTNAAQSGARSIAIAADALGDSVRVTVSDTGPGMSKAELERAFRDFYTTKTGGTGLGLTIVRRLVRDLGGGLRVTSEPGKGTTVEVSLPSAPPPAGSSV